MHQYFPQHIGGTEVIVRGLAARLRARGHEPVIIAYVESPSNHLQDFGFRVSAFDDTPIWELHYNLSCAPHPAEAEFSNPLLANLIARAAREIRPDMIHAAHLMKFGAAVVPRLKEDGLPVVVTLPDFWPVCLRHTLMKPDGSVCQTGPDHPQRCLMCAQATHGFARPAAPCANEPDLWAAARHAEDSVSPEIDPAFRRDVIAVGRRRDSVREMMLKADRVIALSHFQRQVLLEHGYPPERLEVIEHGIETGPLAAARRLRRSPDVTLPRPHRIVFLGALQPHKGAHILLEAMRQAPEADVRLDLFGPPSPDAAYAARLLELADRDPRIAFRGLLPPERLGEALADAAALAAPAQWLENDPLVVKAALWCGVPAAASRLGSLAARLDQVEDCWLLPPADVAAWAAWIEQIGREPVRTVNPTSAPPTADEFAARIQSVYENLIT